MGNGISCCCRGAQDNVKQDGEHQEHLETSKITPTLVKSHSILFSNTIEQISKEPTIKQVQSDLSHSPNLYHKPTRKFSNTTSMVIARDMQRTHVPNKMKSASKMKCPRIIGNSISPCKKNSVERKPTPKNSNQIEINIFHKYNQIMNYKLCEFSRNINSNNKHNNQSSTYKSQSQKIYINLSKNNEMDHSYTKVDTESLSADQISFIKRILSEEEFILEQMDEHIK